MEARNRSLPEWFNRIRSRLITLPRFQRYTAWGHSEVSGLLTTVLRGLPAGAALVLEVGNQEQFVSRTMIDAPETGERVTEQLLDGQQRLTALWRSLHDKYLDRTYVIKFVSDNNTDQVVLPTVEGVARWQKNDELYPKWVDSPFECWKRKFIPLELLKPGETISDIDKWIATALGEDVTDRNFLMQQIINLKERVNAFNLPYLALPASTPKDVALDVFIKMNTSSVRLSTYDIVVALVEEHTGESLRDFVEKLLQEVPRANDYADVPGLVLDVMALRQDRVPNQAGYMGMNYGLMLKEWPTLVDGIKGMVAFLEEEKIFDEKRLPSYPPIPVVAALWEHLPKAPDELGNARRALKKFLWRSFLTSRYEQSSSFNSLQDYRGLLKVISDKGSEESAPIFNQSVYPLPNKEIFLQAEWPKGKTILGRGLLALQIKAGSEDLADGQPATVHSITIKNPPREYHHLYPRKLLSDAGIADEKIYRSLNCALVTSTTNRKISDKDPLKYLKERAVNCDLGEDELKHRIRTHLIPFDALNVGYDDKTDEERRAQVKIDYEFFLNSRAEIMEKAAIIACDGRFLDQGKLL